jgi:hypothetical protein
LGLQFDFPQLDRYVYIDAYARYVNITESELISYRSNFTVGKKAGDANETSNSVDSKFSFLEIDWKIYTLWNVLQNFLRTKS